MTPEGWEEQHRQAMKASGLSTTVNGKKKKPPTKPPVGLDPHMLGNRAIGAAGLGKRGEITKACILP